MNQQPQQQQMMPPIIDAQEPSEKSKRINTTFDELETKQIETLDESGKVSSNASRPFSASSSASRS